MPLSHLHINNFRNLTSIQLDLATDGFNFIYGDNGSGKTSLLEAIYYLGVGKSFRASSFERLIRHQTDQLLVAAHARHADHTSALGIERHRNGTMKIRVRGKEAESIAELVQFLPIRLVNASCHSLLEGEPQFRRKYVDWGIFYQNEQFLSVWRHFNRLLKQRNQALQKKCHKNEIDTWTQGLLESALQIDQWRQQYVQNLLPYLNAMLAELLSSAITTEAVIASPASFAGRGNPVSIDYYPGWNKNFSYAEILAESLAQDLRQGYTQYGPHRADLKFQIKQIPAKDMLSRGQQKLFVCAMIVAQGALLAASGESKPIYLIDDLPAELDTKSRASLMTLLTQQQTQVFITATKSESLNDIRTLCQQAVKMFHVKHGSAVEVSD